MEIGFSRKRFILKRAWRQLRNVLLLSLLSSQPSFGQEGTDYLRINVLVDELSRFDIRRGSFSIGFYIWYQTSINKPSYLDSLIIKNALEMKVSERAQVLTGEGIVYRQYVRAVVPHQWDVRNFPYDIQYLKVPLRIEDFTYNQLRFISNNTSAIINEGLELGEWSIIGASIFGTRSRASSALGDPANTNLGETTFPAADLSITVSRSSRLGFWKMITGTIAAAMLAFIAFFIPLKTPVPRFALIAGSVFTNVISMRNTSIDLSAMGVITLIDQIHILVMIFIGISAFMSIWSIRPKADTLDIAKMYRRNVAVAWIAAMALVLAVLALILFRSQL